MTFRTMHKSRRILTDSKKCEIIRFLLGNYPVSEFYMLMFLHTYLPMKMEQTECSEMSPYKIQMPGNYPEERIQHSEHGESLK